VALLNERSIARQSRARVLAGVLPALGLERVAKRLFDIVASTTSLILLSPIIFIVSAAIKFDSRGPIFSRETLYGYGNTIRAFKFRSVPACRETQPNSRFTRVGRIIRRAGIDELPQLLNVLRGEMSLVGPRPYSSRPDMSESQPLPSGFKLGMTSWAQVNESREGFRTTEQCINDDLHYIENWSLLLDFKIILLTVFSNKL
jgi:lipopolysaccharide/colanic/teichoic acid biosynthesis glycosyltransferase